MADLEVENTLREIRERVVADAQRRGPVAANGVAAPSANGVAAGPVSNGQGGPASEALARMDANIATTARAWSRLPPLLSYRRGAAARFEIWLKRLVKRAAHWFTWEQVNFNSAVHHALGDARAVLVAQEQALARMHEELLGAMRVQRAEAHALRAEAHALRAEAHALRAEAEADRTRATELQARLARAETLVAEAQARFESGGAQLRQAFAAGLERIAESQRASMNAMQEELGARAEAELDARDEALHTETNTRAAELHAELRERLDGLLEEQRVCFKQLSLEAGELAVTHDRARRQLEARLEALEGKK